MPEDDSPLVLRSINLPLDMDERLREVAFRLRRSKSEVIRWCIERGLRELGAGADNQAEPERALTTLPETEIQKKYSESEQKQWNDDYRRLSESLPQSSRKSEQS
ncbi:MAG TPA: ribbon-helix-helix protein, CopG family [Stellaceae bacterium]|nr:ribbon-helix-helix protein, CopG family [Stellaceae bacterium]